MVFGFNETSETSLKGFPAQHRSATQFDLSLELWTWIVCFPVPALIRGGGNVSIMLSYSARVQPCSLRASWIISSRHTACRRTSLIRNGSSSGIRTRDLLKTILMYLRTERIGEIDTHLSTRDLFPTVCVPDTRTRPTW